jgi:hypothetical protein
VPFTPSKLIACLLSLCAIASVHAQPQGMAEDRAGDTILIIGISPANFDDGRETEAHVTVAYDLVSFDEAEIQLGANALQAQGFSDFAFAKVKKGTGTITIHGKFVPRHWGASTSARIAAYLTGGNNSLTRKRPVASDQVSIAVTPRPQPELDSHNPNPSITYEDTLRIVAVSPEILIAGQETEVAVTVAYELLSREQGEINLGHSLGRGNGYTIAGTARVSIGKGEIVVRASLTPVKTGKLPFTKLFVNLSEFPHRETWVPLANDSHAVELR